MATQAIAKAILGAGDVRLDIYDPDAQAWGGLGDILEADKFEITPNSELKRKQSKSRAAYGQNVATVPIAKPTTIAITISALSREALAMQFAGIVTDVSQAAGAIADTVTAKLDKWVKLSKRNLTNVGFTVKDSTDTTTFDLGSDYLIDYATGEIKPLSTGDITANQVLHVVATALAYNETRIRGGVRSQLKCRAVWQGVNQVDGQYIEAEAYEAVLSSSKGFDFLADDFNGIELTGELNVPEGKTEPFIVRMKQPTA